MISSPDPKRSRGVVPVLKTFWDAIVASIADNVPRAGASLAYYTLFAVGPILLIATYVAGLVFGPDAVQGNLSGEIERLVGSQGAHAVESMLVAANQNQSAGHLATVIGTATLVLTAIGAFVELQTALNAIWRVKPDPGFHLKHFILDRLRSFGLVVGLGFLLMVTLVVSALLSAMGKWLGGLSGVQTVWHALDIIVSLGVFATLFAAVYKFLPDVKLGWRDVWIGGLATAVLFTVGKYLIGLYIGQSSVASTYGAAGSVIVMLLWVYYSSQIVLFGAEFTRLWTERTRGKPLPESYARRETIPGKTPGGIGIKAPA
jgi:membrane protein